MIAITQSYISCPLYMTYFENDVILEGAVADFMKKVKKVSLTKIENKIKKIKQNIIKAGVDVKKIEQIVKLEASEAVKGLRAKDTNAISTALKNIFTEMKENNLVQQLLPTMKILLVVFSINFLFGQIFSLATLSSSLSHALVATFVGPLVEEVGKFFSIKRKATGLYFILFNVGEFTQYVADMISSGISWPVAVGKRSLGLVFHAITTIFQKIQQEKGTPTKGLPISILMHTLWNGLVSLDTFLKYI